MGEGRCGAGRGRLARNQPFPHRTDARSARRLAPRERRCRHPQPRQYEKERTAPCAFTLAVSLFGSRALRRCQRHGLVPLSLAATVRALAADGVEKLQKRLGKSAPELWGSGAATVAEIPKITEQHAYHHFVAASLPLVRGEGLARITNDRHFNEALGTRRARYDQQAVTKTAPSGGHALRTTPGREAIKSGLVRYAPRCAPLWVRIGAPCGYGPQQSPRS
jgi:hypothetical protein